MVNIVVMRHGEAEPMTRQDSQRQLTARGKQEAQQMAQWLHNCYSRFNWVWCSPYQRARQTADFMLAKQGSECQLMIQPELVPDGNPQLVLDAIDARLSEQPDARILLVSHMPLVSFLIAALTKPDQTPVFSTAGLCCIDYQPVRGGRLLEQVSPQDVLFMSH
ncbi:phosphohistidine phosphatase [Arsukibacterium ikkense]|uniref:Phosphohistidine phosphatase n=1 Tax=Arsukibacterium ikkense TaxID=336831 RepID=A0A0M2VB46_9GAMM|nr:phosphohistidine phosphatase SixA [Arsukibacterium ikkense]KKO46845.1 phosphohistidine phosphatase [Arsukibacterium ikkense]